MKALSNAFEKYGILISDDAAQAKGGQIYGIRSGAINHGATFSFYSGKNIGKLDDSSTLTANAFAGRIRLLRSLSSKKKHNNEVKDCNSQFGEFQSAVLFNRLEVLILRKTHHTKKAYQYTAALFDIEGLNLPEKGSTLERTLRFNAVKSECRNQFATFLDKRGIGTTLYCLIPPHHSATFCHLKYSFGSFPFDQKLVYSALNLPVAQHLTVRQTNHVENSS